MTKHLPPHPPPQGGDAVLGDGRWAAENAYLQRNNVTKSQSFANMIQFFRSQQVCVWAGFVFLVGRYQATLPKQEHLKPSLTFFVFFVSPAQDFTVHISTAWGFQKMLNII